MSVRLGRRRVDRMRLGRGRMAGDLVMHAPDAGVIFTGELAEGRPACYGGRRRAHDGALEIDAPHVWAARRDCGIGEALQR